MKRNARAQLLPVSLLACAALFTASAYAFGAPKSDKPAPAQKPVAKKTTPAKAKKAAPSKAAKASAQRASTKGKAPSAKKSSAKEAAKKSSAKETAKPAPHPARAKPAEVPMPPVRPRAVTLASAAGAPALPVVSALPAAPAKAPDTAPASFAARFLAAAVPMAMSPVVEATPEPAPTPRSGPTSALSYAPVAPPSESDVEGVREAINLARRGSTDRATERRDQIRDTGGQRLVEWVILRTPESNASFARYAAFVRNNPSWPSISMIRRRAEGQLWHERREPGTVFAFFSTQEPLSSRGKLAMARALLAQGDHAAAQRYVREAWRESDLSEATEQQVLEMFGDLLGRADHKARMDARLYADDLVTALRAAKRLGSAEVAIVQARAAVNRRAANAGALLDAVPQSAHGDPAYLFTRIQWLRRNDRIAEAAKLALAAPHDPAVIHDADEWWVERRLVLRKLLDQGDAQGAYRIARNAAPPSKEMNAVDRPFTAGWIALRFLNDQATARQHFAEIARVTQHPTSLARGDYWLGRTAEAAGRRDEARRHYEAASRHSASYYGQLARARLGHRDLAVRRPPALSATQRASLRNVDLVRAVELLYATNNRDLVIPFVADLDRVGDVGALTMVAEIAARNEDARAMLYLGKDALARGLAFDYYAFPGVGIPKFASLGPQTADQGLVYAIARQESAFQPRVVSTAQAVGLMQVTAGTGRGIARKHGVKFDPKRLLNDSVYNVQMGAAEIGDLVSSYDGNHVLAFVGYNAGRGRVREWVERYGDPRDPRVDVVDWVERIPFTETRNYVQRVMENVQVYRARFGSGGRFTIEADMRGARQ